MGKSKNALTAAMLFAAIVIFGITYHENASAAGRTTGAVPFNEEDAARMPFQEFQQVRESSTGGTTLTFGAVPNGMLLVIKEVSVDFSVKTGGAVRPALLSGTAADRLFLPMTKQNSIDGFDEWNTNQQVLYYVAAGDQPSVSLGVDPGHAAGKLATSVALTGYYVSAP